MTRFLVLTALAVAYFAVLAAQPALSAEQKLLNASYDVSRELFVAENEAFIKKNPGVTIDQSHAGTSKQARSIVEGLEADVVTFNQSTDIDFLAKQGFVSKDWTKAFANNASPFYSFPSFLVRAGNPKNIKDWGDLARDDVHAVFPNPKTSGNARYTYLAAYAWAKEAYKDDAEKIEAYITKIFNNVPVFDTGGRASTTTFVERGQGDVLITFEAETRGIVKQYGADKVTSVIPSVSLLAEFPVAVVDKVAKKHGTEALSKAYLDFLYTEEGQRIAAQFGHRVNNEKVAGEFKSEFPTIRLVKVEDTFGGWDKVQKEHFASGGTLDKLYGSR
ncbi:thiosulfate ABC transporter substrate-binding protein CysP [Rhizobium sp. XQZ8]|uniref:thiosulfate ABC transporter substrate-binding protein CysP n=1 Tax=Rhizobium populisoli TaxID=2859785 RepID=UPI001CA5990E|nr:thiosulfate ABC transporter substrate-binding protein CysP [Rhizobium populisoli]MBW6421879.1 thiosulfate ABC transporter substrate-binding protein CysP [Rhizobium populisoli]